MFVWNLLRVCTEASARRKLLWDTVILGFHLDILGPMSIVVLWIRSGIYIYIHIFYLHKFKEPTGVFVHQQLKHKIVHFLSDVFFNRPASNRSNSFFKPSTGMEGGSIPNGILLEHSLQRTPRRCGPFGHSNKGGCSSSPKRVDQPTWKPGEHIHQFCTGFSSWIICMTI